MTSRAGIVLESALHSPGVVGAALVDSTGDVIGTASLGEGDLASSGPAAIELLKRWTVVGAALAIGTPKFLMIDREGSQTAITPAGPDATLMLSGTRSCGPGRLRVEARRAREALLRAESAPATPAGNAPPAAIGHRDRFVRTTEEGPSSTTSGVTAGEVVLIGARAIGRMIWKVFVTAVVSFVCLFTGVLGRPLFPNATRDVSPQVRPAAAFSSNTSPSRSNDSDSRYKAPHAPASFAAAEQIRGGQNIPAHLLAEPTGKGSAAVQKAQRAIPAGPKRPQPDGSPPARPPVPTSVTPGPPAPALPANRPSAARGNPRTPAPMGASPPSSPAVTGAQEPDLEFVSRTGPLAAPVDQAGAQPAGSPPPAPPPSSVPGYANGAVNTGGTNKGSVSATPGTAAKNAGGGLPLVPLFPNPKPRGDQ
jgi:predicted regulator of Ras-like GTPase activity (Roadblock/LC7/MglB family)